MTDAGSDGNGFALKSLNERMRGMLIELSSYCYDLRGQNARMIGAVFTGPSPLLERVAHICSESADAEMKKISDAASEELIPSFFKQVEPGPAAQAFLSWWRDDAERSKCFLDQALGSYCSGFPGRVLPLLVELLEGK